VDRNFPEKVKIFKNNLKLTKESQAALSSQLQKAFPLSGVPRRCIQQSLMIVESEIAISMSPFGGESRRS
jgi:hypothetical protein